jgi:hypothetical protein
VADAAARSERVASVPVPASCGELTVATVVVGGVEATGVETKGVAPPPPALKNGSRPVAGNVIAVVDVVVEPASTAALTSLPEGEVCAAGNAADVAEVTELAAAAALPDPVLPDAVLPDAVLPDGADVGAADAGAAVVGAVVVGVTTGAGPGNGWISPSLSGVGWVTVSGVAVAISRSAGVRVGKGSATSTT